MPMNQNKDKSVKTNRIRNDCTATHTTL